MLYAIRPFSYLIIRALGFLHVPLFLHRFLFRFFFVFNGILLNGIGPGMTCTRRGKRSRRGAGQNQEAAQESALEEVYFRTFEMWAGLSE